MSKPATKQTRYSVLELEDNINILSKHVRRKDVFAFLRDVKETFGKEGIKGIDPNNATQLSKLAVLGSQYGITDLLLDSYDNRLIDAIISSACAVLCDALYVTEDFITRPDCFDIIGNDVMSALLTVSERRVVEWNIYTGESLEEVPQRLVIDPSLYSDYIIVASDIRRTDGTYEHFPVMYIERSKGMCYFQHYTSQYTNYDSFTLPCVSGRERYSKARLNVLCKKYMQSHEDYVNSHYVDAHVCNLLIALSAIACYDKASTSVVKVRSEADVTRSVNKACRSARGISVANVDTVERIVDNQVTVESLVTRRVYERKPWQGGHHASPIPHDRKGYWRRKSKKNPDEMIWVDAYHVKSPNYKGNSDLRLNAVVI